MIFPDKLQHYQMSSERVCCLVLFLVLYFLSLKMYVTEYFIFLSQAHYTGPAGYARSQWYPTKKTVSTPQKVHLNELSRFVLNNLKKFTSTWGVSGDHDQREERSFF